MTPSHIVFSNLAALCYSSARVPSQANLDESIFNRLLIWTSLFFVANSSSSN